MICYTYKKANIIKVLIRVRNILHPRTMSDINFVKSMQLELEQCFARSKASDDFPPRDLNTFSSAPASHCVIMPLRQKPQCSCHFKAHHFGERPGQVLRLAIWSGNLTSCDHLFQQQQKTSPAAKQTKAFALFQVWLNV